MLPFSYGFQNDQLEAAVNGFITFLPVNLLQDHLSHSDHGCRLDNSGTTNNALRRFLKRILKSGFIESLFGLIELHIP